MSDSTLSDAGQAPVLLNWRTWLFPVIGSAILLLIESNDYLLFHTLAELFAIIVSVLMFTIAWETHDYAPNRFLTYIATGYLWVGVLDLLHTFSYEGLTLLPGGGANMSTQWWISARFLEAVVLLTAPLCAGYRLPRPAMMGGFGLYAALIAVLIFSGLFPTTYIPGQGLTPLKIYSEYAIIAILLAALFTLHANRHRLKVEEPVLIYISIVLTVIAELSFTFYVSVFDLSLIVGHLFKFFSFWLIFVAIIECNLHRPYIELKRSRRVAMDASQAKSDFLAHMSHELRTPLNSIIGFSDILRGGATGNLQPSQQREYLDIIHQSGQELLQLIDGILDLSQVESGHYLLHEQAVDLPAITQSCIDSFFPQIYEKRLKLETSYPTPCPGLHADPQALSQMMKNLLSNAIKFSPEGALINLSWTEGGDGTLIFSVTDRGPGMDPPAATGFPEPFSNRDPHLSTPTQGLGLGLHICQRLASMHGATLILRRNPQGGTIASIRFPAMRTYRARQEESARARQGDSSG